MADWGRLSFERVRAKLARFLYIFDKLRSASGPFGALLR